MKTNKHNEVNKYNPKQTNNRTMNTLAYNISGNEALINTIIALAEASKAFEQLISNPEEFAEATLGAEISPELYEFSDQLTNVEQELRSLLATAMTISRVRA